MERSKSLQVETMSIMPSMVPSKTNEREEEVSNREKDQRAKKSPKKGGLLVVTFLSFIRENHDLKEPAIFK